MAKKRRIQKVIDGTIAVTVPRCRVADLEVCGAAYADWTGNPEDARKGASILRWLLRNSAADYREKKLKSKPGRRR